MCDLAGGTQIDLWRWPRPDVSLLRLDSTGLVYIQYVYVLRRS